MALDFQIDETLVNAMIDAAGKGFELGGKKATCVSIGKASPTSLAKVTGIIGVAGRVNGSIIVNMSEQAALRVVSGMLMEAFHVVNDDVLDGLGEITNVIGGRLKSSLANIGYPIDNITLPSVIVGENYFVTHSKGMLVFTVGMVIDDPEITSEQDRLAQVAMTLLTSDIGRKAQ